MKPTRGAQPRSVATRVPDQSHVMWGGRFAEPMDPRLDRLNRSLPVDRRLWREDLATNRAWVRALERCGVLTAHERQAMLASMEEGLLAVDEESTILNLNDTCGALLGVDPEKARGRLVHEVIRKSTLLEFVERTLATATPVDIPISRLMRVADPETPSDKRVIPITSGSKVTKRKKAFLMPSKIKSI